MWLQHCQSHPAPALLEVAGVSWACGVLDDNAPDASHAAGGRDSISSPDDVELLKRRLQPGILQLHNHQPDYAHLDFELVRLSAFDAVASCAAAFC